MKSYWRHLAAIIVAMLFGNVEAAETAASAQLSSRYQTASAAGRGDFTRASAVSLRHLSKAHSFSADRDSMSVSSAVAVRVGKGAVRGTGFNLTIGRTGSTRGISVAAGESVRIEGKTSPDLILTRAHANGRFADVLSRTRSFSR
jgi:hypothetical protein